MRCLMPVLSFFVAASVVAMAPLYAHAPKEATPCSLWILPDFAPDRKEVIASCTQLIDGGKLTGRLLVRAYLTRAMASVDTATGATDHGRIIADTTKAIEINPQVRLAYLLRCGSYMEKGEHDRAIADATKYVELDPTDWNALNVRASAYVAKGEYDLAIADDTKAVEMAPKSSIAYANRASTYFEAGKMAEALSDIDKALSLPRPVPHHYYRRGQILEAIGRTKEAIATYRTALRLEPGHKAYREALMRLGVAP